MTIVEFRPEHLLQMKFQARQQRTLAHMTIEWLMRLAHGGPAVSVMVDGEIIACGGVLMHSAQSGFVWSVLSRDAAAHFLGLHRAARRFLATAPKLDRMEAVTEVDFPQGRRWLELLGFKCEGRIAKDGADGEDHFLYARAQEAA